MPEKVTPQTLPGASPGSIFVTTSMKDVLTRDGRRCRARILRCPGGQDWETSRDVCGVTFSSIVPFALTTFAQKFRLGAHTALPEGGYSPAGPFPLGYFIRAERPRQAFARMLLPKPICPPPIWTTRP